MCPSHVATACATAFVPSAKRGHSKTPIGPFQKTVAPRDVPRSRARLRADVEAEPAVRDVVVRRDPRLGIRVEEAAATTSTGSSTGNEERVLVAELLGHLAADEHGVRPAAEVLEDAELVLDLGAARDEHERPLDVAEQPAELLELPLEQQPGVGRQQVRDTLGRACARWAEPNASLT